MAPAEMASAEMTSTEMKPSEMKPTEMKHINETRVWLAKGVGGGLNAKAFWRYEQIMRYIKGRIVPKVGAKVRARF